MDKLYHKGVMRTKCDDCQFVCITQTDYFSILHKGEENTRKHEENGRVVLVTEQRAQLGSNQRSHIVIKVRALIGLSLRIDGAIDPCSFVCLFFLALPLVSARLS